MQLVVQAPALSVLGDLGQILSPIRASITPFVIWQEWEKLPQRLLGNLKRQCKRKHLAYCWSAIAMLFSLLFP